MIRTRADLRQAKKDVSALIDKAIKTAKRRGYRLTFGTWGQKCTGPEFKNHSAPVCLVGAIGLTTLIGKGKMLKPEAVAPLIRNGASKWIDDVELEILSHGFETTLYGDWDVKRYYDVDNRWQEDFYNWLFQQGQEIRKLVIKDTE